MVLAIVGVVILAFSISVYSLAQKDFKDNPFDFTPYEDEALMIYVTQKVASNIMTLMYLGCLVLGAYAIVTGLGSLM